MRKNTFANKETKIEIGGNIKSPYMEKTGITLNDYLDSVGCFRSKTFIRCYDCGNLVTAGSKSKQRCHKCNKEHYNKYHNNFYNKNKSFYLYVIEDKDGIVRYAGITTSMNRRVSEHINLRVSATRELFKNNNWKCFKFVDLAAVVNSENELKVLENVMMSDLNTYKNSDSIKDIDKKRREELLEEFKYHDFKVYKENIN
ncbi:TPA: GIY-YIG nuclease family protein [Clostridium perfringens]|uniref:GIY-YIG nuclease family protein n=1 Tax=Clostridium perfringens TaxID=1502 RepID=UPI001CB467E0|nr:GIY-YIG nuclease family protein [Clostridium perfringens]MDK0658198.1 GIY-YIG nuclease family protein [Clostridium perfringens]MDM0661869.1 GIY-YIG nuclease family protein [Clostridium perfringens]HBI6221950.1 GIY-YIG nuclease family protein [Clostridium perfringens]HBI7059935.1 GIY-YIG nuclease family protein [Clostridium perfringens]HBI7063919.1 GIY-YIG nuclease family protein [Clostridium perfringens]